MGALISAPLIAFVVEFLVDRADQFDGNYVESVGEKEEVLRDLMFGRLESLSICRDVPAVLRSRSSSSMGKMSPLKSWARASKIAYVKSLSSRTRGNLSSANLLSRAGVEGRLF